MNEMKYQVYAVFLIMLIAGGIVSYYAYQANPNPLREASFKKFHSCSSLANSFREAWRNAREGYMVETLKSLGQPTPLAAENGRTPEYSTTNIQVAGVDEADIVKTDGEYIYAVTQERHGGVKGKMIIARAYPPEESEVVSETVLENFQPSEMFIHGKYVIIFGQSRESIPVPEHGGVVPKMEILPYPYYPQLTTVQIWDVTDRSNPELIRSVDFEGSYLSSRKIGPYVYFVVNSPPKYHILEQGGDENILPLYRDRKEMDIGKNTSFTKICGCSEVGYFEPMNPENFITIASLSLEDPEGKINKKVIVGSGQNIYASLENLYVAEMNYPFWFAAREAGMPTEKTIVHKFSLDNGDISYLGNGEVPGRILNQFSMDEWDSHFRIATTLGRLGRSGGHTSNNVYVFDSGLNMVGKLEDIAPGESIYSARFIGERGYLVTFRKVDPFFVLDLSNHTKPKILGKLKIPGYSDYLHPYDENHIIGIGKETEPAEEGDFSWYQGVKMAIFDVTDVSNPKELHKVVIGDRGTDSYALHDHKAFLFDREKNLLVIPILLAVMTEEQKSDEKKAWEYGDYVFQGAYVYNISLENGFILKGRITHYDDNETFLKSGYYYFGGEYSVKRSLYIDNVLYTISGKKIMLNSLDDLSEINTLVFSNNN